MDEKKDETEIESGEKEVIKSEDNEKKLDDDKKEIDNSEKKSEEKKFSVNDKKDKLIEKARENPWMVSTVVLGILFLGFLFSGSGFTGSVITGGAIGVSADVASDNFQSFALSKGIDVEVNDIREKDGLYEISFSTEEGDSFVYITKDGKNIVSGLIPLVVSEKESIDTLEVPKTDRPEVELFIMTHCPYGTQAEKGFIPTMKALEGVADLKIRFVHYFMHTNNQEDVETPRQVCIREEQSEKYLDYLECFLGGTSGSVEEALACEVKIGIDSDALSDCIDSGRGEEYYAEDSALSKSYGVQGSPSLVINGVLVKSGRDSESYLNVICSSSFNEVPEEECMAELSSVAPSPGFGWEGTGSASTAQC